MKQINFTIIVVLFAFSSCNYRSSNAKKTENILFQSDSVVCSLDTVKLYPVIPDKLGNYIKEHLPDYSFNLYRIGQLQDFEEGILSRTPYPFFAQGDFTGDSLLDYIIIMNNEKDNKLNIIVFNSNNESYEPYFIDAYLLQYYNQYKNEILISLEINPKGEFIGVEDDTMHINNDYFSISFSDASRTKTYVWDNEEYQDISFD